ncbi:MAG: glycosyltransferase [Candidatus Dadabacteria bacterium]|nr:MAG: glycosyltransferase [Candidatus Dadabacteria bacterium]
MAKGLHFIMQPRAVKVPAYDKQVLLMSDSLYLIVHKDHAFDVRGVNSGAEMATLSLARYLVRAGKRVIVAAQLKEAEEEVDGIQFWDLGPEFDLKHIFERVRAEGHYHLISAGRAQPIFFSQHDPLCLSRLLISHDRAGNDTGIKPEVLCRIVDRVICVSNAQRQVFLDAGGDPEKITVVHNGVDLDLFYASDPQERDYRRLVFVGAMIQDKGPHVLLNSFAELKQKYPDLKLDLYGSASLWGREKFLDDKAIEAQLPDVKFYGKQPQSVIADAYRKAGICVVPSIWFDPFPLTALEAQVTGCPTVVFDVGGLAEGVSDGETGVVVREISQQALTAALDSLLGDPEKLKSMSKRAIEKARPYFNWKRVAATIIEISEQAACGRFKKKAVTRKKLGFVTTWDQECGLATYAAYLLEQFNSKDYVVLAENAEITHNSSAKAKVIRCWKRGESSLERLRDAIIENDIGLVHINAHDHNFFDIAAFELFAADLKNAGIKIISHLHTTFTSSENFRRYLRSVDGIIVHTPENRLQVIASGADPESVYVLPHGVHLRDRQVEDKRSASRKALGLPENQKVIVSFGFIQPNKGIEALIEGVAHLVQRGIDTAGYVLGRINNAHPGAAQYFNELKSMAASLGVQDKIHFSNCFLPEQEVYHYIEASDLVIMNYHSQYFEASGACSIALGCGAVVATSTSPLFSAFGDAVWRFTAGFPPAKSVELLLTDPILRKTLRENALRYARENCWTNVARRLREIYFDFDFVPYGNKKEKAVETNSTTSRNQSAGRILIQNRSNAYTQRGGDTIMMDRVISILKKAGYSVTVDLEGKEDPSQYDLVHLFNFALPDMLKIMASRAVERGTPFVVSTMCEDVPSFHNQSHAVAATLVEYVRRGQDRRWYESNRPDISQVQACQAFDNEWVARNAHMLFTSGPSESALLKRYYPGINNLIETPVGFENLKDSGNVSADLFIKEFGVKDFILCVGRLESRKNQLMLLKALEDSDLPVVLAGGGFSYQPEYEQAVRNFRRAGKTIITGRLSDEMLLSAYKAAKIHVLPSWYELPGLVSLEAAMHGCNVVATKNGSAADYLDKYAFYCEPSNESSIFNAVVAAYYAPVNPELREHVKGISWDRFAESLLNAYGQLAGKKRAPEARVAAPININAGSQSSKEGEDSGFMQVLLAGEEAARNREYSEAHKQLKKALELQPDSVRALRAVGAVHLAQGEHHEAIKYFERAYQLDKKDPKTLSGIGMCKMMQNNPLEAYPYFVEALEIVPDELVTILQLVEASYAIDRFDDLERILRGYVAHHPEDVEMRYCLAGSLYKLGELDAAEAMADKVLAAKPMHLGAKQLKNVIAEDRTAKASQRFSSGVGRINIPTQQQSEEVPIVTSTNNGTDNIDLAISELEESKRKKDYMRVKEGIEKLLNGVKLNEAQQEKVNVLSAEIAVLEGNFDLAHSRYDQILARNPKSARSLCGKGALAGNSDNWEEARRYFEEAHSIDPNYDVPLAGLGLYWARMRNQEKAWDYYQQALQRNPENTRALLGLIELGYPMKRLSEVEKALENYLDMHPADLNFLYSLAGCYFARDKLAEAMDAVEKIILFTPDHKNALELRDMIKERLGELSGNSLRENG